jgi:hypothetical protein
MEAEAKSSSCGRIGTDGPILLIDGVDGCLPAFRRAACAPQMTELSSFLQRVHEGGFIRRVSARAARLGEKQPMYQLHSDTAIAEMCGCAHVRLLLHIAVGVPTIARAHAQSWRRSTAAAALSSGGSPNVAACSAEILFGPRNMP